MNLQSFILVLALVMAVLAAIKLTEPARLSYGWTAVALIIASQFTSIFR